MKTLDFRTYVLAMDFLPPEVRQALADAGEKLTEEDRTVIATQLREGFEAHARLLQTGLAHMERVVRQGKKHSRSDDEQQQRAEEALPDLSA